MVILTTTPGRYNNCVCNPPTLKIRNSPLDVATATCVLFTLIDYKHNVEKDGKDGYSNNLLIIYFIPINNNALDRNISTLRSLQNCKTIINNRGCAKNMKLFL